VIDGGIGQLGAAMEAITDLGLPQIAMCGLAKAKGEKDERIYLSGHKSPIVLPLKSPGSRLVQTIRDEAHRFAITFHRKLRSQSIFVRSEKSGVRSNHKDVKREA
jgi:excinuclease ABC subunit C